MFSANVEMVITLLPIIIPLVVVARHVGISYPIVLVIGGLFIGFVPRLPIITLDPQLVLLIFLPPLLYWQAITAPTEIMRANAGQIGVLAIGLVVATTVAVALVAHQIVPNMPWGAAFVLGAVIAPTDELAAMPVLQYFRLPRHITAIIEGESLFNDATALVIYAAAVAATASTFNAGQTILRFILSAAASIAIGYLAGRLAVELWRRIADPELQGLISLMAPFLAYLPAQYAGFSGVLAVVATGIYANRFTPRVMNPLARPQIIGFWKTLAFAANAMLFFIVGLQLRAVAEAAFSHDSWQIVVAYAAVTNVVVITVRLLLVVLAEFAPTAAPPDHAAPDWRNALIVAWSGSRGSVSLAAAFAIPFTLADGSAFPYRDTIVFVTFSVILVTLVGGGSTMPWLIRRLHVEGDCQERDELQRALTRSAEAALTRIAELERAGRIDAGYAQAMRRRHEGRIALATYDERMADQISREAAARAEILAAQRSAVIDMRDRGEIDNVVLREVQSRLDAAAQRA